MEKMESPLGYLCFKSIIYRIVVISTMSIFFYFQIEMCLFKLGAISNACF